MPDMHQCDRLLWRTAVVGLSFGCALLMPGCEIRQRPPAARDYTGAPAPTPDPNPTRLTTGQAGAPGPLEPAHPALPLIAARDGRFVDPDGRPVTLRGCNLGNWLLLEMWMLDLPGVQDQAAFEDILVSRFGPRGRDELLDVYRENFIGARDFPILRSFGFNVVRVPFEYRLLEDEQRPMHLKADAFRWLDRAVQLAQEHGMHAILDLHGAPGRQSVDHTTGQAGRNGLWTDRQAQDRTVWLWKEIAAHFRDSTAVAGYDLVNEPFGDYRTPAHLPALADLMARLYREIRAVDDRHILFIAGAQQGLDHYGWPEVRGWTNIAFTEHYYPGLFGTEASLETHARFLGQIVPRRAAHLQDMRTAMLVGEFNVVHRSLSAPALMRHYFDAYAARGWAATMWSYKLLRRSGGTGGDFWGLVANRDPLQMPDPRTASFEDLKTFFISLGTMPCSVYEDLRMALTNESPAAVSLAEYPVLRDAPARDEVPGWQAADIGGARPGGQRRLTGGGLEVYGGGADVWNRRDQFRYIWRGVAGDVRVSARVDDLADTDPHAKAGLMLRNSTAADAAHVYLHAFPDGRVMLGWRSADGAETRERELGTARWPVWLSLEQRRGTVRAAYSTDGQAWHTSTLAPPVSLPRFPLAGLAVLAHSENELLTSAIFQHIGAEH